MEEQVRSSDLDFSLSRDELARFHRNGYIGPFDLYQKDDMERKLQALYKAKRDGKGRWCWWTPELVSATERL